MFIGISWEEEAWTRSLLCVHCLGDGPNEAMFYFNQSGLTQDTRAYYNCSVWLVSNLRRVCVWICAHVSLCLSCVKSDFRLLWWRGGGGDTLERKRVKKLKQRTLAVKMQNNKHLDRSTETNGLNIRTRHDWEIHSPFMSLSKNFAFHLLKIFHT